MWRFVHGWLPAPPAAVVEIGCGPLGGFVPMLRSAGYDASCVDPEAPEGPGYHRVEFEQHELPGGAAVVVACASLHHVGDVGEVLGRAGAGLTSGGGAGVWSGRGSGWTRQPRGGASTGCPRRKPTITGCGIATTNGRTPGCPGKAIAGPGRPRRACTRARRSCANWTTGSTPSSSATG